MQLDSQVTDLLQDSKANELGPAATEFWIIVRSVRDFFAKTGSLPITGRLPDMTSTTTLYVSLQRIFHDKAASDVLNVIELVESHAVACGATLTPAYRQNTEHMCKNFRNLRCIRYTPLAERVAPTVAAAECVGAYKSMYLPASSKAALLCI